MVKEIDLGKLIADSQSEILDLWQKELIINAKLLVESIGVKEMKLQTNQFIKLFIKAIGVTFDVGEKDFEPVVKSLNEFSKLMKEMNIPPTETSFFTFSIKNAIFPILQKNYTGTQLYSMLKNVNNVVDRMSNHIFNEYLQSREAIIFEQQKALLETSIPIVKLWNGILLIPLVGMLDSSRIQLMIENILSSIENTQAKIVIIDISGIPVVDSLVARHFITAANAVKLMGGECIITGIRAIISQTLVQLGIDLSGIITRKSLADGLQYSLEKMGKRISIENERVIQ